MTSEARPENDPLASLLAGYRPVPGAFDELVDASGKPRAHWQSLLASLGRIAPRDRLARAARLDRQVRETGLVHDIFADPDRPLQQWRLNLMPLIVSAGEWHWLERAIAQRARLFEAIIDDVYGAQRLMRSGLIPASVVLADPAFLRACHGIRPSWGHLQFYAADLARGPDGSWRVIDNHAETPAGVGYAVANRVMHADVADDLFLECNARRLSRHFMGVKSALADRSGRSDPNIVLLTPGPDHDDYFSHAYLARYLDVGLVEGGDLRTVGDELFLKTLEGPKKVDAVIRCIEGGKCDPLELDPASFLGPSGLVHACRKSPDLVVNAIGSAIVENRALGTSLPELAQELLGEQLMLHDAPRWWLGDEEARQHVEQHLDDMVIRPAREGTARPGRATHGRAASAMSVAERERLLLDIRRNGHSLVAEARVGFGTMPSLSAQGLAPRAIAVRLFAAAGRDGFRVMPGGLAMGVDPNSAVALSAADGETHDVWVLGDAPEAQHASLWRPRLETALVQRSQRTLQSRVADNLFWLGRYLERADWTMRVIRASLGRRLEYLDSAPTRHAGDLVLEMLIAKGDDMTGPPAPRPAARRALALSGRLATRRDGHYGLIGSFDGVYRVASLTRDRLSLEAWRTLAAFRVDDGWRRRIAEASTSELQDEMEDKLSLVATFNGHMHENMTRNFGWLFIDMGRRLERAYNLCDTLGLLFSTPHAEDDDNEHLNFILRLADSYITYRSRYRLQPMLPLVLDLLLMDETNPRSVAFQLASLEHHLEALPQSREGNALTRERRLVLGLQTAIRLADVNELSAEPESGRRLALAELLDKARAEIPHISEAISRRYFRLVEEAPHRVAMRQERRR
ncbi:MAG: circularly permuted type 2 ATP-grasp protein [Hyphomicrobiaceae bacterium]|nr:circularly permuted type 2 ATP-grasp protein [Hyphomicrobiaceae bacterium]